MTALSPQARLSWCAHFWKAATQQHHREYRPLFRRFVPEDGVVCDVGAHAGQFIKLLSRMAPRGRVYAFEPGDYACSILRRVVAVPRLTNVEICPIDLGARAEAATLSVPIKRSGSMGFGLGHIGADPRASATESVPLTALDAFVHDRDLKRLDFIKADIEGWEMRMLAGGAGAIARFRPALMLEVLAAHLARQRHTGRGLALLRRAGLSRRAHRSPGGEARSGAGGRGQRRRFSLAAEQARRLIAL
jgi:FkbM family methyltransferase